MIELETTTNGGYIIKGESVNHYRLLMLRSALKMEIKGLRISSHRPTAYTVIKNEFNLKGSKLKVLRAYELILINDYGLTLTNPS